MRKKSLSTLGYIMESLNIQTVSMSRALIVDASLVSKWKTGDRTLSGKSIYFDDVINYIMEQSAFSKHKLLTHALTNLYPHEKLSSDTQLEGQLRQAITTAALPTDSKSANFKTEGLKSTSTLIFEDNVGKRAAISELLNYAERMTSSGEIIFIDSEEYAWLLEDHAYAEQFVKRVGALLKSGFHAKFIIHYSSYRERFFEFFNTCSALIFHQNVEWYYYEYYDENIFDFSIFILNRAVSLLGLSNHDAHSTTMIFEDNAVVMQHQLLAEHAICGCKQLFTAFKLSQFEEVLADVYPYHTKGAYYSFLPAPTFISTKPSLLREILAENNVNEEETLKCLSLNNKLCRIISNQGHPSKKYPTQLIRIFQLEEMQQFLDKHKCISESLSLIVGKPIKITANEYAHQLRDLAVDLQEQDDLQIVLASEKDDIALPSINCWCKQNTWMVQMDEHGFRLCDETSIVNTASISLGRCVRKVPPERKEKKAVIKYLLELASTLDT